MRLEKATFLLIGSGESYFTEQVIAENLIERIMVATNGDKENWDEDWLQSVTAMISDDDNWAHDSDFGPVHWHTELGETDRIDIYRLTHL